ncbi:MAG: hypothetical protein LBI39_00145 [Puniceicoccales bacterium]|jgi:hypothetical protein|nr:hypothetical protein [Puniceicoccales bacterium]
MQDSQITQPGNLERFFLRKCAAQSFGLDAVGAAVSQTSAAFAASSLVNDAAIHMATEGVFGDALACYANGARASVLITVLCIIISIITLGLFYAIGFAAVKAKHKENGDFFQALVADAKAALDTDSSGKWKPYIDEQIVNGCATKYFAEKLFGDGGAGDSLRASIEKASRGELIAAVEAANVAPAVASVFASGKATGANSPTQINSVVAPIFRALRLLPQATGAPSPQPTIFTVSGGATVDEVVKFASAVGAQASHRLKNWQAQAAEEGEPGEIKNPLLEKEGLDLMDEYVHYHTVKKMLTTKDNSGHASNTSIETPEHPLHGFFSGEGMWLCEGPGCGNKAQPLQAALSGKMKDMLPSIKDVGSFVENAVTNALKTSSDPQSLSAHIEVDVRDIQEFLSDISKCDYSGFCGIMENVYGSDFSDDVDEGDWVTYKSEDPDRIELTGFLEAAKALLEDIRDGLSRSSFTENPKGDGGVTAEAYSRCAAAVRRQLVCHFGGSNPSGAISKRQASTIRCETIKRLHGPTAITLDEEDTLGSVFKGQFNTPSINDVDIDKDYTVHSLRCVAFRLGEASSLVSILPDGCKDEIGIATTIARHALALFETTGNNGQLTAIVKNLDAKLGELRPKLIADNGAKWTLEQLSELLGPCGLQIQAGSKAQFTVDSICSYDKAYNFVDAIFSLLNDALAAAKNIANLDLANTNRSVLEEALTQSLDDFSRRYCTHTIGLTAVAAAEGAGGDVRNPACPLHLAFCGEAAQRSDWMQLIDNAIAGNGNLGSALSDNFNTARKIFAGAAKWIINSIRSANNQGHVALNGSFNSIFKIFDSNFCTFINGLGSGGKKDSNDSDDDSDDEENCATAGLAGFLIQPENPKDEQLSAVSTDTAANSLASDDANRMLLQGMRAMIDTIYRTLMESDFTEEKVGDAAARCYAAAIRDWRKPGSDDYIFRQKERAFDAKHNTPDAIAEVATDVLETARSAILGS